MSREYIVLTKDFKGFNLSFGSGWGKFAGKKTYNNPLSFINDSLRSRPSFSENYDYGGKPSYDQWFRGDISLFGGAEIYVPKANGLKIKIEYDPYDYFDFTANNRPDAVYEKRVKDSNINFGLSYPINRFLSLDAAYIKGNTFNFSFNIALGMKKDLNKKNTFKPKLSIKDNPNKIKKIFYEELLKNLNENNLLLQTASLKEEKLNIAISNADYRNAIRASSNAVKISKKIIDEHQIKVNSISLTQINAGVELNKITYPINFFDDKKSIPIEVKKRYVNFDSGNKNSYLKNEFRPNIDFPIIFSEFKPIIVNHIGNPEKFYFGGIALQNESEIQFSRNLLLTTEINYSIYNNFEDTVSGPGSKMQHVRTDLVQYLKNSEFYISRMQLDYLWSPFKNIYAKMSAGIFEMMYAGIGTEFLYTPFKNNFYINLNSFYVKQREFDQKLEFRDYETSTGHLSLGYIFPKGVESKISYGRYLAKDDGYTFDLSRELNSGFRAGFYFTRTDVPSEIFGEGSFDKGFYFKFPLDLFTKDYIGGYTEFKLSPLTRDGGAKLVYGKDLQGLIHNSTKYRLRRNWDEFNN